MRFISAVMGFNIALLGLNASNMTAIATIAPSTSVAKIDRLAIAKSKQTIIKGNGVEFTVPAGFKGGSPSSSFVKEMIAATAKVMPSMLPFVQTLDSDPSILSAIAIDTSSSQDPSLILVNRLPVPANISLAELRDAMSKMMPSVLPPEFKLVDNRITKIKSRQIVQMKVEIDFQGGRIEELVGLFKEGDDVFQLTYVHGDRNSRQANLVLQQAIDTFKATPKPPA